MSSCIFCKIVKGEIPSTKVYEDEHVLAFKDINPIAKIHLLFVNKEHTSDIADLLVKDPKQVVQIFSAIQNHCKASGLEQKSFRIFTNKGSEAGQTVFHTHFHLISSDGSGRI